MTTKTLKAFFLILTLVLTTAAYSSDHTNIPIQLSDIEDSVLNVSTGDYYRVASFSTEDEPCLLIQKINKRKDSKKPLQSTKLCKFSVGKEQYDASSKEIQSISYDDIDWEKNNILEFEVTLDLARAPSFKLECTFNPSVDMKAAAASCKRKS